MLHLTCKLHPWATTALLTALRAHGTAHRNRLGRVPVPVYRLQLTDYTLQIQCSAVLNY